MFLNSSHRVVVITPFLPALGTHGGAAHFFNFWTAIREVAPSLDIHMCCLTMKSERTVEHVRKLKNSIENLYLFNQNEDKDLCFESLIYNDDAITRYHNTKLMDHLVQLCTNTCNIQTHLVIEMELIMHYVKYITNISSATLTILEPLAKRFQREWIANKDKKDLADYFKKCYKSFYKFEKHYIYRFSNYFCLNNQDKKYIRNEFNINGIKLIPLAINIDNFSHYLHEQYIPYTVGFVGSYMHPPNIDAVNYFLSQIWPLVVKKVNNAIFKIYGNYCDTNLRKKWSQFKNVEVVGYVDNIAKAIASCQIIVNPIVSGYGTRTKCIEALAVGKPIVTTKLGAQGIALQNGKNSFIADEPELFAKYILELLDNPAIGNNFVSNARQAIEYHDRYKVAQKFLTGMNIPFIK